MASVAFEQVKDRLYNESQLYEQLEALELDSVIPVTKDTKVSFDISPEWSLELDAIPDSAPVKAYMTVDGYGERQLSKEALFQAALATGLQAATVRKAPVKAIATWMNQISADVPEEYNVLTVDGLAAGFTAPKILPFSNTRLVENIIGAVRNKYGQDAEVYADYKLAHSLTRTDLRLIVPAESRHIKGTDMNDVPAGKKDTWAAGVTLTNSLTGQYTTALSSYMFRWWCTNGSTEMAAKVGKWDRRSDKTEGEGVYAWAAGAAFDILKNMEERFDAIQNLVSMPVPDARTALSTMFDHYHLPARHQTAVLNELVEAGDLTLYKIMQAVTRLANDPTLNPADVSRFMLMGGDLAAVGVHDPAKALVWEQGHVAEPGAVNPFEGNRR